MINFKDTIMFITESVKETKRTCIEVITTLYTANNRAMHCLNNEV